MGWGFLSRVEVPGLKAEDPGGLPSVGTTRVEWEPGWEAGEKSRGTVSQKHTI